MALYTFWDRTSGVLVVYVDGQGQSSLPVALKFMRRTEGKPETIAICPIWAGEANYGETVPSCVVQLPSGIQDIMIWPLFGTDRPVSNETRKAYQAEVSFQDALTDEEAMNVAHEYWSVDGNRAEPEAVLSFSSNPSQERRTELLNRANTEVFVSFRQGSVTTPIQLASLAERLPRVNVHVTPTTDEDGTPLPGVFDVTFEVGFLPDGLVEALKLDVWHAVASHHALRMINGKDVDAMPFRSRLTLDKGRLSDTCQVPLRAAGAQVDLGSFGFLDRLVIEVNQPVELVFYNDDTIAPRSFDGFMVLAYYGTSLFIVDRGEFLNQISRKSQLRKYEPVSAKWVPRHQEVSDAIGHDLTTRDYKLPFLASLGTYQSLLGREHEGDFKAYSLKPNGFSEFASAAAYFGLLLVADFFDGAFEKPPAGEGEQLKWLVKVNEGVVLERLNRSHLTVSAQHRDNWLAQFEDAPWDLTELLLCLDDIVELVTLGLKIAPEDPSVFIAQYPARKERLADLHAHEILLQQWDLHEAHAADGEDKLQPMRIVQDRVDSVAFQVRRLESDLSELVLRADVFMRDPPSNLLEFLQRKGKITQSPMMQRAEEELSAALTKAAETGDQEKLVHKAKQLLLQQMDPELTRLSSAVASLQQKPAAAVAQGLQETGGDSFRLNMAESRMEQMAKIEAMQSNFRVVNTLRREALQQIRSQGSVSF